MNYLIKSPLTLLLAVFFIFQSCAQQPQKGGLGGFLEKAGQVINGGTGGSLTNDDIVQGLKEALKVGISNGSSKASALDGYYRNDLIRLAFPPDVQKVETRLPSAQLLQIPMLATANFSLKV